MTATAAPVSRRRLQRHLERRLRPLYVTGFLQAFAFWYAIEKEFQVSIGFSAFTITLATVIYNAFMAAANTPLGILTDRWSRKGVLHLATCALILASLLCGLSNGFWLYAAGLAVWGLYYGCYDGIYDSLFWDVLIEDAGTADAFQDYYGRWQRNYAAAMITGAVLSAGLSQIVSLRTEFFLTVPVTCCAFFSLRGFREPLLHKAQTSRLGVHVTQVLRAVASREARWVAAALVVNMVAMRLIFEFMQLWYIGLGLASWLFGVSFACVYCGSFLAGQFGNRLRKSAAALTGLVTVSASTGLLTRIPVVTVGAQIAAIAGIIALQSVLFGCLHEAIPSSSIRAGTSSVVGTASMVLLMPIALGFGFVARQRGIFPASWFVVGLLAAMTALLARICLTPERNDPSRIERHSQRPDPIG